MYAAGHPPLPSFEVAAFNEQMPRHWQYLREKPEEVQKLLEYNPKDWEQTKLVLVGAAVSLRESMRLLAHQASDCEKALEDRHAAPDRRALDLANFDCYACHHDLKSPSWRQKRGFAGKPGRVPMRPWATALVELAIGQVAEDARQARKMTADYRRLLKQVEAGFDARPFGDPRRIKPAAQKLAKWADALAAKVNDRVCAAEAARQARRRLLALCQDALLDYDSARQVAWAFRVMWDESQQISKGKPDPKVRAVLADLQERLGLQFPKGRRRIVSDLGRSMKARNDYDPDPFRSDLRILFKRLGGR
jgi:hypothetical protein